MRISPEKFSLFLSDRSLPNLTLLYGNSIQMKEFFYQKIRRNFNDILVLSEEIFVKEKPYLAGNLLKSYTNILVLDVTEKNKKYYEEIINTQDKIILLGKDIKYKSSFANYFETNRVYCAVPCFDAFPQTAKNLMKTEISGLKVTFKTKEKILNEFELSEIFTFLDQARLIEKERHIQSLIISKEKEINFFQQVLNRNYVERITIPICKEAIGYGKSLLLLLLGEQNKDLYISRRSKMQMERDKEQFSFEEIKIAIDKFQAAEQSLLQENPAKALYMLNV